jgi:hypothetical protein
MVDDKKVIQCYIRDISERKRNENRLKKANDDLLALVDELQKHDRDMKFVNRLNDPLQACKKKEEAYQVIALTVGELFSGLNGGPAILQNSGQYLETLAQL